MNLRHAASSLLAISLFASLQVGCTAGGPDSLGDDVDAAAQALDADLAGLELADLTLEVDGAPAGFARSVSVDELGEVSVTFVAGESDPLLDALLLSLGGDDFELELRMQSGASDELDLERAVLKEVTFTGLDAKDGKGFFQVTAKFQPQNLHYTGAGGKAQGVLTQPTAPKRWSFEVPGLDPSTVEGFTLSAKRDTKAYAPWTVDGLKTDISATGYEAAKELVDAGIEVPVDFVLTDESTGAVARVKTKGKPKKGTSTSTTTTVDLGIDGESVEAEHKDWTF